MIVMAIFGFCLVGASTPLWVGHTWVNGVDCGSVVDESTEREAVALAAYDHSEWEGHSCDEELEQTRTTAVLMVVAGLVLVIGAGLALLAGRYPEKGLVSARARTEGEDPRP